MEINQKISSEFLRNLVLLIASLKIALRKVLFGEVSQFLSFWGEFFLIMLYFLRGIQIF